MVDVIERPQCCWCGASGEVLYLRSQDRLFSAPGEWTIRQCPACHYAWLDPAPAEHELPRLYEHYFTHANGARGWESRNPLFRLWVRLGAAYRAVIQSTSAGRLRARAEYCFLDDLAPGRLLDVGCGSGDFLARMRGCGWQVTGQDVDGAAVAHARDVYGLTVHAGPLAQLGLQPAQFDAITLSHVIEHVHDAGGLLAECRRLLAPGGRLVALTPNILSFGHARYRRNWLALEAPRHIGLFSPAALAQAARLAGFDPAMSRVWTNSTRAQMIGIASDDIARTGRHDLGATYRLPQLLAGMAFEWRAWRALTRDPMSGEELVLEARA